MAKTKQKPETPDPIAVKIGGEHYELVCSRHARRIINRLVGGMQPAADAVRHENDEHIAAVVMAGAGLKVTDNKLANLEDEIWQATDKSDIYESVGRFVVRMRNGGRDPEPETDDDSADTSTAGEPAEGNG